MLRIGLTVLAVMVVAACTNVRPARPLAPADAVPTGGESSPAGTSSTAPADPSPTEATVAAIPDASLLTIQEYPVPPGSRPHDVAPAPDGTVWYTAQGAGALGRLDPATGEARHIPLGAGSAPHGVIVGPDGAPWITDGGLNAIVRVDPVTEVVERFPLPAPTGYANLNTAAFDGKGDLWFTGQSGIYGRLVPATGQLDVFDAPRGPGPYGIAATREGIVYYASLAGSHIARIDPTADAALVLEPPTAGQGARRVWPDSRGRIWISEWNAGQLGMYDPAAGTWREWRLPGDNPHAYAVYVDERDAVWLSDFGANALVRFDPAREAFDVLPLPSPSANVRQLLGRPGEVWGAASGVDKLVVVRSPPTSATGACPVTEPVWVKAPDDPAVQGAPAYGYYFVNPDRSMWAAAWWTSEEGRTWFIREEGIKVGWFRPAGALLEITGQRIDDQAPPLEAHIPCCYPTLFQATGLYFPTAGCWAVTAKAADRELAFVVRLEP